MKITVPYDISNFVYTDPDFIRNLAITINTIAQILNGNINFADNVSCRLLTCSFQKANTDQAFLHNLNRLPKGYFIVGKLASTDIYNGLNGNTVQFIYLRSTVVTAVNVIVF